MENFIVLIVDYDQFIHDRVLNPLFKIIQKYFHFNRFDLLYINKIVALSTEFLILSEIMVDGIQLLSIGEIMIGQVLFFFWFLRMVFGVKWLLPELKKASQKFEQNESYIPHAFVLYYMVHAKHRRKTSFVMIHIMIFCTVISGPYAYMAITALIMFVVWWFELHLWDSDDVDPVDRVYSNEKVHAF